MADQKIIDIIAAHRGRERGMVCDEGELWCDGCSAIVNADHLAQHIVIALRANNIAVVELPDPCDGPDGDGQLWFDDYAVRADPTGSLHQRRIVTDFGMGTEFKTDLSPVRARCLGAALLAAADAAERAE